jgi:hypothetical protein
VTAARDDAAPGLDDAFRAALQELEEYLDGVPDERLTDMVLPFASRWVLPQAGFDLPRLRQEARTLVEATPFPERILEGYVGQVAWWVSQRMLLDDAEETDLAAAQTKLDAAREALAERAATVEAAGFPLVGHAFRLVLVETAEGEPPANPLWSALALRIAESVL